MNKIIKKIYRYFLIIFLFLILIFINILRPIVDELYVLSFVLIILIFFLIQIYNLGYKIIICLSLSAFLASIITYSLNYKNFPIFLANISIFFLILGTASIFLDNLREKIVLKNTFKLFRNILIVLIAITILAPFGIYRNHIPDFTQFIKQNSLRIFNSKAYHNYNMKLITKNKNIYTKNMKLILDEPVSFNFYKSEEDIVNFLGWAADFNTERGTGIDNIEFWLDGKPLEGEFLGKAKIGIERNDIAEKYGEKFRKSGYSFDLNIANIEKGTHELNICAHSLYFGWENITYNINISDVLDKENNKGQSILLTHNTNFEKNWRPVNQCKFKYENNGIKIIVSGDDPYFESIFDLSSMKGKNLTVEIIINTVVKSNLQLFFKEKNQEYNSENSFSYNLYIGRNDIFIQLPSINIDKIRIDPVNNKMDCNIEKIEFYEGAN